MNEARDWLIVLHEHPDSRELRAEFAAWLAESQAHADAWSETQRVWGLIGQTQPVYTEQWPRAPAKDVQKGRRAGHRSWPSLHGPRVAGVTAAVLGLCVLAWLVLPLAGIHWQADYTTGTGETRRVVLEDASVVHMGPQSALDLREGPATRGAVLLAGEAFFEVTPDPTHPFSVTAGGLTATALGTAFNVNRGSSRTTVTVAEGAVRVATPDEQPDSSAPVAARLGPGDWIRVTRQSGLIARGHLPPEQVAAWRTGRLVVQHQTVGDVVETIRRYHPGLILLTDQALASRSVTGVYDLSHPVNALRAVVYPHHAVVRQLTPYLLIVSPSS